MAEGNPKDLFQSVMQLAADEKIREALNSLKCLTAAAQIRTQAERIAAAAKEMAAGEKEVGPVTSDLPAAKGVFGPMEGGFRGMSGMLEGLANKELAAIFTLTMPVDRLYAEAHFRRSRVLADMLAASSYYRVTAELISLAMKTLDKCAAAMKAGEIALLLGHASALLVDAARFMATAGAELADNDVRWEDLKAAVKQL
ncbi:MAG: hypothetical protein AB1512_04680 [Thermodesulfobacteriota bacterium]